MNPLRRERLNRNMTISELSKAMKMTSANISRIENSIPKYLTAHIITRIAMYFHLDCETFYAEYLRERKQLQKQDEE